MPNQFIVRSSGGNILANADTGVVEGIEKEPGYEGQNDDIEKFDIAEYRQWDATLPAPNQTPNEADIILIGFWTKDGNYVAASAPDRNDTIQRIANN